MINIKRALITGALAASILASAVPAFADNPNQVDTTSPNCHGKLASLNAKGHGGLQNASEAKHPNYGDGGPADSVQDFQEEMRELCS
ncbi:hypothetical protein A2774_01180 [Candidatus Roizmanbacteria bacterium RIFCSPHIGHO2_01_FULL_39_12c]|uniref:Uncharacterized protein n=1 Tax=Candidatus Roizmanbacteria bacterium RIFCSPHIGHO2_01_FULL_39_12c TaxID=1802031 RepID=A0A1F7G835_9BACT|nr:MAG: hypothetical protein A2774_01180 [Candidatus Roizmanbacteria bacterium RIFCSPHIGHO2_01_FULL_39_12c]OGK46441.1 MAG: hypothetical protein A2963_01585 [Candidatus Roizmanbacteria bacterium RIFCSPLOWO2_01_FULL_40_13]